MNRAFDALQRATFEAPHIVALGPTVSAVLSGFAVVWMGKPYLTPAGQRYLDALDANQETMQ